MIQFPRQLRPSAQRPPHSSDLVKFTSSRFGSPALSAGEAASYLGLGSVPYLCRPGVTPRASRTQGYLSRGTPFSSIIIRHTLVLRAPRAGWRRSIDRSVNSCRATPWLKLSPNKDSTHRSGEPNLPEYVQRPWSRSINEMAMGYRICMDMYGLCGMDPKDRNELVRVSSWDVSRAGDLPHMSAQMVTTNFTKSVSSMCSRSQVLSSILL